jgi:hypothetical protein
VNCCLKTVWVIHITLYLGSAGTACKNEKSVHYCGFQAAIQQLHAWWCMNIWILRVDHKKNMHAGSTSKTLGSYKSMLFNSLLASHIALVHVVQLVINCVSSIMRLYMYIVFIPQAELPIPSPASSRCWVQHSVPAYWCPPSQSMCCWRRPCHHLGPCAMISPINSKKSGVASNYTI